MGGAINHYTGKEPTFERIARTKNELQTQHRLCGALALTRMPAPNDMAVYVSVLHTRRTAHGCFPPSCAYPVLPFGALDLLFRSSTMYPIQPPPWLTTPKSDHVARHDRAGITPNLAPLGPPAYARRLPPRRYIYPRADLRPHYNSAIPLGTSSGTTWYGNGRDDGDDGERC
ncbi:hypothetical protein PENSPDRAFT_692314 [Peniophora sp. CONT]|nr:hypothetical protein PENSPDRAFT_692314 [Peniophora sp. CONT]